MAEQMLNSTKPHNKSSGTPGIGQTVTDMNEWDMNKINDTIADKKRRS